MKFPETVYHGTFWPEGRGFNSDLLVTPGGYVSTTEIWGWALYFARVKRHAYAGEAGVLAIYSIDTANLPLDMMQRCIPPEEYDPRAEIDENLRIAEEELQADRIRMREWRFPYVPLQATRFSGGLVAPESRFASACYTLLSIPITHAGDGLGRHAGSCIF